MNVTVLHSALTDDSKKVLCLKRHCKFTFEICLHIFVIKETHNLRLQPRCDGNSDVQLSLCKLTAAGC